ncbi:hypothetical protein Q4566_15125 [Tamlana sp. 2_MG-2023]|uniref:hypothetical protein n=1 Tax=unclassified Tamlana TaxID=2614803 RepID=UPI0026E1D485|nr:MULTISPECIES: hypothetical protein [unclassified Tamlana]MDO6761543.1 hypothetical protein [Tamlana sp. 2_MG-2023]MDO6792363.1 hypothetical protein [Tamlana sp. 1_MG-2023]
MKKFTLTVFIFLFALANVVAQQEKGIIGKDNWLNNWTDFQSSNQDDHVEPTQILTGNITEDKRLIKRHVYLLVGSIFVTNNAVLTIEPGTVIIGDYASKASLTIAKGSSIVASGLETDPIIFTSNRRVKKAGDWGGLIILGDAATNRFGNGSVSPYYTRLAPANYAFTNFGGENPNANSGLLKYVRIEYAGSRVKTGLNFNGLLLAGVGRETVLENVMVSNSAGNSVEVWGGNVNLNKFVSYKSNQTDYKFNYGVQGELINSLAVRSPYVSSSSGARSLEVVAYTERQEVDFSKPSTSVKAENLTILNSSKDLREDIRMGLVKEGVYVGEHASLDMNKSVISGFNPAVIFESKIQINQESLDKIRFTNMYFNNCNGNIFVENSSNNEDLENWYGNHAFFNVYSKGHDAETFIEINNPRRPDYRLRINKIIASNEVDAN